MSQAHISLNASDAKFWDFSWQQIGQMDLPASIDYVLNTTNTRKLNYVGFSQGTISCLIQTEVKLNLKTEILQLYSTPKNRFPKGSTTFLVMTSTRPEYNDKIIRANLMAPAAFLAESGKKTISQYYWHLNTLCDKMGYHKLTNDIKLFRREVENCRSTSSWATKRCEYFTNFFGLERVNPVSI